ncbi:MAG TPA: hypothetical protein VEL76_02955, partial [Gemmataceae bacterium]|nr:hypothetical protein [Gemmataceae bacterium]
STIHHEGGHLMTRTHKRRLALCGVLALALGVVLLGRAGGQPAFKTEYYKGKVVPLAGVLAKSGVRLDADAAPQWLALVSDDGKVYPLIKDDGARMFFKDARLLNRPMRLTGRLVGATNLLQVVNVHSYQNGKLHEVYYWCDICSIRGYELHKCDCCGDPMVLREVPAP